MQHVCSKNGEAERLVSQSRSLARDSDRHDVLTPPPPPCVSAAARYCSMLLEEGGLQQLELVHTNPQTHKDVELLAASILESLQRHRGRTGPAPTTGPAPQR